MNECLVDRLALQGADVQRRSIEPKPENGNIDPGVRVTN